MTQSGSDRPRIYVASLSDYNSGRLVGEWIDLDGKSVEDVESEIQNMLKGSEMPAEEWAIHDNDNFDDIGLGEHESIERVVKVADMLDEHGPAFAGWYVNETRDVDDLDNFTDEYLGEWGNLGDYARELAEDLAENRDAFDNWPMTCVDWEHAGEELRLGGDVWTALTSEYNVYVYWSA